MDSLIDELRQLWSAGWPYVQLHSVDEERVLRLLREATDAWAVPLQVWSRGARNELAATDPQRALRQFAEGHGSAVLLVLDLHDELEQAPTQRALLDLAARLERERRMVVFLRASRELPAVLREVVVTVDVPPPDLRALRALAERVGPMTDERKRRVAGAALGLSEPHALRALRAAQDAPDDEQALSRVLREKRRRMGEGGSLELIDGSFTLSDVGGLHSLKRWLRERAEAFGDRARDYGLPPPRGVLLLGVQGCGKSMSAKVIAHEFGVPLLRLDLSSVFGGEAAPEAAMRRALRTAERFAPVVLWIDEIEKGFAGADSEGQVVSTTSARILGSFVTWMQEKKAPVFVVATANEVRSLPPELLRRGRFDEIFFLDLPDPAARVDILRVHLRRHGRNAQDFELEPLGQLTAHFSGAELEQVVLTALLRAFTEQRELTQADLVRAASDLVPLYRTYEERIKALRAWSRHRARPAGSTESVAELLLATQRPVDA
ncbi:MAG: AAA family ATPase [Myxococcales bacterium]|nr:AAA family ATPase [Myxococcales bacterium]MCB9629528.1 AAA family ATPase [Sandaracinaceae bacterium]